MLPDVVTNGQNFRPYAPVQEYKFVYTTCSGAREVFRFSPSICWVTKNETGKNEIRAWLDAELVDSHIEALVNFGDLIIHPNWNHGSIQYF